MPTVTQIRETIASMTGVPESVVDTINRRLAEGDLVPHHRRGRHAEDYQPIHVARLLVGVLAASDAFGSKITRSGHAVQRLSELQDARGPGVVQKGGGTREKLVSGGGFTDAVGDMLDRMRKDPNAATRRSLRQVGLVFGASSVMAYADFQVADGSTDRVVYVRPGDDPLRITGASMAREVRVTGVVLRGLADLLAAPSAAETSAAAPR